LASNPLAATLFEFFGEGAHDSSVMAPRISLRSRSSHNDTLTGPPFPRDGTARFSMAWLRKPSGRVSARRSQGQGAATSCQSFVSRRRKYGAAPKPLPAAHGSKETPVGC